MQPRHDLSPGRWFFALWPDAKTLAHISECIYTALAQQQGRRIVATARHLTVVFLGRLNATEQTQAIAVADQVNLPAFELTLDEIGYFPQAKVLWLGPAHIPSPLSALQQRLTASLRASGFALESRAYHPHITLYRKAQRPSDTPLRLEQTVVWPVSEFVLAQSLPAGAAVRYRAIAKWPLKATT